MAKIQKPPIELKLMIDPGIFKEFQSLQTNLGIDPVKSLYFSLLLTNSLLKFNRNGYELIMVKGAEVEHVSWPIIV